MSWNPLKKLGKPQSYGFSVERDELENKIAKLNETEKLTKTLIKDAKKLCECILTMNRYENKITTDMSHSIWCQEDEQLRNVIQEWHSFVRETDKNSDEFACTIQKIIIEPLKQINSCYADIRSELKKCEQFQHDCTKYSQKVQKYSEKEKTSQNLVKLSEAKKSLEHAEQELKIQLNVLNREIPLFINTRIDYFQPSLAALIRAETLFWGDTVKSFNDHSSMVDLQNKIDTKQYQKLQLKRLQDINALSIVAHDSHDAHKPA